MPGDYKLCYTMLLLAIGMIYTIFISMMFPHVPHVSTIRSRNLAGPSQSRGKISLYNGPWPLDPYGPWIPMALGGGPSPIASPVGSPTDFDDPSVKRLYFLQS